MGVEKLDAGPVGALRIAPSILAADFGTLADSVRAVDGQTDWVHVDVMDGHFVPNISIGPPVVQSLRPYSERFFDCHLMISDPARYLEAFKKAGADGCTVHVEVGNTASLIADLRALDLSIGLAANPDTPFSAVEEFLGDIDLLLLMTVFPGFGGQSFMGDVMDKVALARKEIDAGQLAVNLEVDGGIDVVTAPIATRAGANVLVAGSAIFNKASPLDAARSIRVAGFAGQT
jgi:ribulose-phosphate 3-epimerase